MGQLSELEGLNQFDEQGQPGHLPKPVLPRFRSLLRSRLIGNRDQRKGSGFEPYPADHKQVP